MAGEPEDLTLVILREIRADVKEVRDNVSRMDQSLQEVRRTLARHELRFDAIEEKFETVREGVISAIGYAANASRAHVDLHRQIADLTKRVEKLEAAK